MADGIKARLQRFNLFNAKAEQRYVSWSALLKFRVMLSGKLTLAPSPEVSRFSQQDAVFPHVFVLTRSDRDPLLLVRLGGMIYGGHRSAIGKRLLSLMTSCSDPIH